MFAFLNKPYPRSEDPQKNLVVSLLIGVFVAFFLIVFQPFGISQWEDENKFMKLAGYGLVSFTIPVLMRALISVLPQRSLEDNWKVWKEIINLLMAVLCIAAGNLLYSNLIGIGQASVSNYFSFIAITFAVGFFPITLGVVTKHNRFLNLNRQRATEINVILDRKPAVGSAASEQNKFVVLTAENEKDQLQVEPHQLLYIEAADNYTEIYYLEVGVMKKTLLRGSLKRLEQQLVPLPYLVRCHRAYIINLENVTHIEGNAAGYKLSLRNAPALVPVSRNFGAEITEKLKKIRFRA